MWSLEENHFKNSIYTSLLNLICEGFREHKENPALWFFFK